MNKKLRLLILDFNSFIISALKIYNTNIYYSENYLYNLNLFEDIDFPEIFNFDDEKPDINCLSLKKFLEEETLKENLCSSLRNFIDFEKNFEKEEGERCSLLIELRIGTIKRIGNISNLLVIINKSDGEIYDNNGRLISSWFSFSSEEIIKISANLIITIWKDGIISLISFEFGKEKDIQDMIDLQRKSLRTRRGRGGGRGVEHLDHIDFINERGSRIIIPKSKQNFIITEKRIFSYENNIIIELNG